MTALPPLLAVDRQPEDPRDCDLCPATERRDQPVAEVEVEHPDGSRVTLMLLCRACESGRLAEAAVVADERWLKGRDALERDRPDVRRHREHMEAMGKSPSSLRVGRGCRVCGSESSCDCERHDPFGERRERRNDEGMAA